MRHEAGVLKLGTISLDGTKVHADASKRKAVSYKRLLELETQLRAEVEELFALSEQSEQPEVPDGLVVSKEIARRQDRLVRLAEAKAVLEARAKERMQPSRRSMRPSWSSARSESARRDAALVAAHRRRRRQGHVMATSTISPTRSHAS